MKSSFKLKTKLGVVHLPIIIVLAILAIPIIFFSSRLVNKDLSVSAATSINYVALGDSITQGFWTVDKNYVTLYKNSISSDLGLSVYLINLGFSGWKSTDLLNALNSDQNFISNVGNADLISVMIGYNDFYLARSSYIGNTCGGTDSQECLRSMVTKFNSNFDAIVTRIKALNNRPLRTLRVADNYYSQIADDYLTGKGQVLNPYLSQMNDHIKNMATESGYRMADVHQAYNGQSGLEDPKAKGYMSDDNVHPNDLGFQVIADNFKSSGYSPLSDDSDLDGIINIKDNCPDVYNPNQLDSNGNGQGDLCETDNDADTFTNAVEHYIGTDGNSNCSKTSNTDAFPPDINRDGTVNIAEILIVSRAFGKSSTLPDWPTFKRYDMDANGTITIADVFLTSKFFGKAFCP